MLKTIRLFKVSFLKLVKINNYKIIYSNNKLNKKLSKLKIKF